MGERKLLDKVIFGVSLRGWPTVIWTRLTYCRRHGHLFKLNDDYCGNCAAPWVFVSASKWRQG